MVGGFESPTSNFLKFEKNVEKTVHTEIFFLQWLGSKLLRRAVEGGTTNDGKLSGEKV